MRFFAAYLRGEGGVGEPLVCEVRERVHPAEAYGGLSVEELFESVRVAFAPPSRLVACRGVFALPQLGEESVEVHGGVPFLLRCWLISSIGEDLALVRSRWFTIRAALKDLEAPHPYALALVKGEAPPARETQTGLLYWTLFERFSSFSPRIFHLLCRLTYIV